VSGKGKKVVKEGGEEEEEAVRPEPKTEIEDGGTYTVPGSMRSMTTGEFDWDSSVTYFFCFCSTTFPFFYFYLEILIFSNL
jgi:hypothetical protein